MDSEFVAKLNSNLLTTYYRAPGLAKLAMPSIPPGSKVLVTGGNGYIGAWVIHTLLSQGFLVRAVVRSEEKAKPLQEHFTTLDTDAKVRDSAAKGGLEFVYVPDFVKEGAFDDVIEGVEAVLHLASPIQTQNGPADGTPWFVSRRPLVLTEDPPNADFILPAVNGTLNLLKAASLPTSIVKRFVYTSSTATVYRPVNAPPPSSPEFASFTTTVLDENDWSVSVETLRELGAKGEDAPFMVKYSASKTLAERAAWDWVKDHKDAIGWDLVVLNPPFVLGVRLPSFARSQCSILNPLSRPRLSAPSLS